jgi:hypothetical protein
LIEFIDLMAKTNKVKYEVGRGRLGLRPVEAMEVGSGNVECGRKGAMEFGIRNAASGLAITSFTASESAGVFGELHIVTAYGCACCRYIPIMILLIGK